jgi:hypothetical protein
VSALTTGEVLRLRGLHCVARIALRVARPLRAKAVVDRAAGGFTLHGGADIARTAVRDLFPAGSCLSRAVAIASVIPGAEVVIGVDPWGSARLSAHAWLEVDGTRVDTNPGDGVDFPDELARIPPHRIREPWRPGQPFGYSEGGGRAARLAEGS